MSPAVVYSLMRLALFVVCLYVFVLIGAGPALAVVLAAVVSMALSYVLLRRQRDAVAAQLAERIERRLASRKATGTGDEAHEDAAVDGAAVDGAAVDGATGDGATGDGAAADGAEGRAAEGGARPPN